MSRDAHIGFDNLAPREESQNEAVLRAWMATASVGDESKPTAPPWTPQVGPQAEFFNSDAYEVLYGGAAGGGKSSSAVALALPWIKHPQLRMLVLRRLTPQLEDLLDKAKGIYRDGVDGEYAGACAKAEFRGDKNTWTFPGGARVRFNHCQHVDDAGSYQGHEYQIVVFDELTQFEEGQYLEIATRIRAGVAGLPRKLRATTNPGGGGHSWVFKRWRWWLDPKAEILGRPPRLDIEGKRLPPAAPGEVLFIVRLPGATEESVVEDGRGGACFVCGEAGACAGDPHDRVVALTRTFIPAKASDNPALMRRDPDYTARLRDNDPVRAAQLIRGDWLVQSGRGLYFRREWVTFVDADAVPKSARRCRGWDRAATEPHDRNKDPDWTRGVRLAVADIPVESAPRPPAPPVPGSRMLGVAAALEQQRKPATDRRYYIEDLVSVRAGPGPVKQLIRATAEIDGKAVRIRLPQDPAQAGKSQAADDVAGLAGFTVTAKPVTGDKITRFGPVSSQAHPQSTGGLVGRFVVVRAPWNEELLRELEGFPDGGHDDIADALSDAFDELAHGPGPPARGVGERSLGFF